MIYQRIAGIAPFLDMNADSLEIDVTGTTKMADMKHVHCRSFRGLWRYAADIHSQGQYRHIGLDGMHALIK